MSDLTTSPWRTPLIEPGDRGGAPVRLVVDALFLRPGRVGGIEFMLYSLLSALVAAKRPEDQVRVLLPEGVDVDGRSFAAEIEAVTVPRLGNRFTTVERYLPRDRDVALFPNYYTPWAATRDRRRPALTVIHDLQFQAFPQNFTPGKRTFQNAAVRRTCAKASTVIAISEFTAGEVAAFRPGVRDRLTVIHNPVDWTRFDREAAPQGPDDLGGDLEREPFFLLAAAQYRHKNIATALEGFRELRARHPRARLVLVGQVADRLRETKVVSPLPRVEGVVELGFVPDAVLSWLYRRATAVLLPSLYEGCGLPCAESLGLGTPVIHSGLGALPEVAGAHGTAVPEPLRAGSWSDALAGALEGRLGRPDPETAAWVRSAHDVRLVGRRYWDAVHSAIAEARFAS